MFLNTKKVIKKVWKNFTRNMERSGFWMENVSSYADKMVKLDCKIRDMGIALANHKGRLYTEVIYPLADYIYANFGCNMDEDELQIEPSRVKLSFTLIPGTGFNMDVYEGLFIGLNSLKEMQEEFGFREVFLESKDIKRAYYDNMNDDMGGAVYSMLKMTVLF